VRAVNLLPTDLRGASKATAERGAGPEASGGASAFVVLGVLAACVAGTAGYVLTENTIKQNRADLEQVTARQHALQAQATKLKPYADFDTSAKARVQTVRDIAGSRFDWEQALRDLSRAIPADVTLKTLNGDISTSAGNSSSSLRGAISAPALTLQGCAADQTSVARLMARLRDVDGVTRVSLSKSAAEKIEAVQGGHSATEDRNSMPCGTGKRPSFEVVMFFEKATAAVSTTPTTAGGNVSATPTPTATPSATPAGTNATTAPQGGATP
jgi:Tfp pilus assembly protein PilN